MHYIDLRSDTVTEPTGEMRQAMAEAPVGDDVYGDDPTVYQLEATAAARLGKEAALFVPTGTMGNQIAIMIHTRPGDEIIAGGGSHVYVNEAGGPARLSGVSCALVRSPMMGPDDVHALVRPLGNVHYPRTSLVCLENALGNGDVMPLDRMRSVTAAAREHGLAIHLDGARIFNAAVSLGVDARDLAACADTVMFCVSKGLCSPVGSLLCGDSASIERARHCRKLLGGGMRQAGVLAACGLISLEKMVDRLAEDHENAKHLGTTLAGMPDFQVDTDAIKINMVFATPTRDSFDHQRFIEFMLNNGVKVGAPSRGTYRFVTHHGVTRQDIDRTTELVRKFCVDLDK